ncbi:MAG TPA: hypothetical protein VHZ96_16180 [Frankiaceae bacterium]|jgi:hypothetical protein|nr:hypothetical protein [Frankiaceae bacterium]
MISPHTIDYHLKDTRPKLSLRSPVLLARIALNADLKSAQTG